MLVEGARFAAKRSGRKLCRAASRATFITAARPAPSSGLSFRCFLCQRQTYDVPDGTVKSKSVARRIASVYFSSSLRFFFSLFCFFHAPRRIAEKNQKLKFKKNNNKFVDNSRSSLP